MDTELLKILRCPETHQELSLATADLVEKLNAQITAGQVKNRAGRVVREKLDAALVRADGRYLYAIHQHIPVMLVDEALPIGP